MPEFTSIMRNFFSRSHAERGNEGHSELFEQTLNRFVRWALLLAISSLVVFCNRTWAQATVNLAVNSASNSALPGPTQDERFLQGLRQRQLFGLAERYCRDQLDRADLPVRHRSRLVIELSRVFAEHAVQSPPNARAPLWKQSHKVLSDFAGKHPNSLRLELVQVQDALIWLAQGQLSRQMAEFAADRDAMLKSARSELRTAIRQLKKLDAAITAKLIERSRTKQAAPKQFSVAELSSLQKNVQYQLGRALSNQGQSYPEGSIDRIDALVQAGKKFALLAKINTSDAYVWNSRCEEIACLRLLKKNTEAEKKIAQLYQMKLTPAVKGRVRAEQIRLLAAQHGKVAKALAAVKADLEAGGRREPDLDYAHLQAYVAAWRIAKEAKNTQMAEALLKGASDQVRYIQREHGTYWAFRADRLLASTDNLAILAGNAAKFYALGRFEEALDEYDRVLKLAAPNTEQAFQYAFWAAEIEQKKLKRHQDAMTRFRELAVKMPKFPRAPEAHILAIFNAGQMAGRQKPPSYDDYQTLLKEHLDKWPESKYTEEVLFRQGLLHEHFKQWKQAITVYQKINPRYGKYLTAIQGISRCYERWIDEVRRLGKPRAKGGSPEEIATEAAKLFENLIIGPEKRWPERWSPVAQFSALAAPKFRIYHTRVGYQIAEQFLKVALEQVAQPEPTPEWKQEAQILLVVALAGQQRIRDALEIIKKISTGKPDQLLLMLQGLSRAAAASSEAQKRSVSQLQLEAVGLLQPHRQKLSKSNLLALDRVYAAALIGLGRRNDALEQYKKLAQANPRNGNIQEAYAELLLAGDDAQSLQMALDKWREVEKRSRPGTARWFHAKYAMARAHLKQGNKATAKKIINFTKVLHPELGGPEMKTRFLVLLKKCE